METKHTPGPWFVDGMEIVSALGSDSGDGCQACDVHSWTIAEISDLAAAVEGLGLVQLSHGVKLANARLIAAAPELLEELEYARTTLSLLRTDVARSAKVDHRWEGMDEKFAEWLGRIDSAIAKATGAEA